MRDKIFKTEYNPRTKRYKQMNLEKMAKETSGGKIYVTFTIDKDIKKRFNIACASLEMNMSEVAQAMMENFIEISKDMADKEIKRLNNLNEVEVEVEFVVGTRLKEN